MRLASEILAGASAGAIVWGTVLWATRPGFPSVSVGYLLGASAMLAALCLAIDGRRA